MSTKIRTALALAFVLLAASAAAAPYVLEVPGPSLVVLETATGGDLALDGDSAQALRPVVLEASPSHLVLAAGGSGVLVLDVPEDAEVVTTITRVRLSEHELRLAGVRAVATSLYDAAVSTKEEDHDIDPDPKGAAGRPLVTLLTLDEAVVLKEEDHDIDPDPKRGPAWHDDWALVSAAVAELGPGWYFVVRGGEVSYEVTVEGR